MSTHPSISIARSFLDLMEDRKIDEARALLASDFRAVYPGDRRFSTLEDLVASGGKRYRDVRKSHDLTLHVPAAEDGIETVIFYGTLSGEWLDGSRFEGIRFTDRFRLRDKRIIEQQVWNDMGEERIRLGIA
jgi:hypothetical protein